MTAALLLTVAVAAAAAVPARAADKAPAAAPAAPSAGDVPDKDRMPNPGSDGGVTPYALKDLDDVIKADQKRMEAELKDSLRAVDAQYDAQKELEGRQFKEKFDYLRKLRDERAEFERSLIDDWRKFAESLRSVEPAERGTEKLAYDQKVMERRHKFDDEQIAKNKDLMEKQQRDRDAFWRKVQQDNNERARQQTENATKWGKAPAAR